MVYVYERPFRGELDGDDPTAVVVRLAGELDPDTVAEAEEVLARACSLTAGDISLDVSELRFISACGLGVLAVLAEEMSRRGHRVHLLGAAPLLLRQLEITELTPYFEVHPFEVQPPR